MEKLKRKGKPKDDTASRVGRREIFLLLAVIGATCVLFWLFGRWYFWNPSERVVVPVAEFAPTYTEHSYIGTVVLRISGTARTTDGLSSDAFYVNPIRRVASPDSPQLAQVGLEIDGQLAIITLGLQDNPPPYLEHHFYALSYDVGAERRRIAFRISDGIDRDSLGNFYIEINQ